MTRIRVIDATVVLLTVRAMLIGLGFPKTLHFLKRRLGRATCNVEPDRASLESAARVVVAAAVMIPGRMECLEQSLALWYLLRRRGVGVDLTFGMRRYPFGAHAWVAYRGEPLNEDREALRQYVAFA